MDEIKKDSHLRGNDELKIKKCHTTAPTVVSINKVII